MTTKIIEKSIKEKQEQIKKLNQDIEKLEADLKKQPADFQEFKINGKTIRVYKWEDKPIKDFIYPKGFQMCEFQDFVDLIDSKKIELETWKYYFVKHFSKSPWNKEYCLSRLYLGRNLVLYSCNVGLAYSIGDGRVVVQEDICKLV
jgi:hypothetical protein